MLRRLSKGWGMLARRVAVLAAALIAMGSVSAAPIAYSEAASGDLPTFTIAPMTDVLGGVFKGAVYGVLIGLAGCLRGMQCGSSSSAVGDAATSAVVTGIVAIVVACGIFAVVFYVLGI